MTPASRRRGLTRAALALTAAAAASCAAQGEGNPVLQSLDRPTDVAFSCYGPLRILDAALPPEDQQIVFTSAPLASCRARSLAANVDISPKPHMPPIYQDIPPGQENRPAQDGRPAQILDVNHRWYAFVLQSVPGTVAIAQAGVKRPGEGYLNREIAILDASPLTPGKNSLSVGSLPIAIAGDTAGCHMITANAGSCDLSIINAERAINSAAEPAVRRQPVTTPSGAPLGARPAAMLAAELAGQEIGRLCPAEPEGLLYIAYPDCHAVAVVHAGTGEVQASIRFDADGNASIDDGELVCAAECGGEPITDGARPVTLDVIRDDAIGTIRLAIGLDNRPVLTVVDLDPSWQPASIEQVELSGDVGVLDVAITPQIGVGGRGPIDNATGTDQAQFIYAVATDGSVRVAEVFDTDIECDTQIDPRFLLNVADASELTCVPVGVPGNPPRRARSDGPGIRIPGDAVPVSVTIARSGLDRQQSAVTPTNMIGTFAYVGLSTGIIAIVNVDDDNYDDLQLTAVDPFATQMALAMPHQPRDSFFERLDRAESDDDDLPLCKTHSVLDSSGGPRAKDPPIQVIRTGTVAASKSPALPFLRQVDCNGQDGRAPASEISLNAPVGVRLETFPDWGGLFLSENWTMTWEGPLSGDSASTAVDGPPIRTGYVEVAGGGIRVHDAAQPYCAIGVEDRDSVVLRGCDPSRGDGQCGPGQTCYVHPDSTQAAGACLPADKLLDLVGPCRDFLVSSRRFAVKRAFAGNLELIERRRSLRTTPITGCTSNEQCQALATYEDSLRSPLGPDEDETPPASRTFACEVDPSRPPLGGQNINRCVQSCTASSECGAGGRCSGFRCIESPVPPPECVVGLQRYEVQASDAFVVLGSTTGYLHTMIADPATGRCVKDPTANPLLAGRIPLTAPPCAGDGVIDVKPNPCSISVEQADEVPRYMPGTCTLGSPATEIVVRNAPAIRFRNPGMTLNLVDATYPGDDRCLGDRGGGLVGVPVTYPGYQIQFVQIAGFSAAAVGGARASYLSRLVRGPDRAVWMVDEGDISTDQVNARGALFRFSVDPPPLGTGVVVR